MCCVVLEYVLVFLRGRLNTHKNQSFSFIRKGIKMATRKMIDEFLACKKLALIRQSRKNPVAGVSISSELEIKGYTVSIVYLDEGPICPKVKQLKEPVGGVIVSVPADQSEKAVLQAIEAQIPRVWLQKGCESLSAIAHCEAKQIPVVYGECVLMFAEPVRSFHAFHRWLWKMFGKLPV